MGPLREQENVPFLSAEEGQQGQFFENLSYGIVLFNLLLPCLWFWGHCPFARRRATCYTEIH